MAENDKTAKAIIKIIGEQQYKSDIEFVKKVLGNNVKLIAFLERCRNAYQGMDI